MITVRFGNKIKLPSTVQLKHQLLLMWLADQETIEETTRTNQIANANAQWTQNRNAASDSI